MRAYNKGGWTTFCICPLDMWLAVVSGATFVLNFARWSGKKPPRFWTFFFFFFLILIRAEQIGKWTVGCLRLFVTLLCCVIHALKPAALGSQFVFFKFLSLFFPSANVLHFYLNRLNCSFWGAATFWKKEEALVRCVSLKTRKSRQQPKLPPALTWGLLHKVKDV